MKDWTSIYADYKGQWVAIADDEETIIAAGKTIASVLDSSTKKGSPDPVLFRVPDEIVDFVGHENSV